MATALRGSESGNQLYNTAAPPVAVFSEMALAPL